MSTSQRTRFFLFARIWCVPAILVIVACIHLNQWHTIKRSSWGTGAGFGMFATVDYHGSRFIYCKADTDHGLVELTIPKEVDDTASLVARTIPSDQNLLRLAEKLSQLQWYLDENQNGRAFGNTLPAKPDSSELLTVHGIDLRIGGMKIDVRDSKITTHLINSIRFRSASEAVAKRGDQDLLAKVSAEEASDVTSL